MKIKNTEFKVIKKEEIPEPARIINQKTSISEDGTIIGTATLVLSKPPVPATNTRGFAKLRFTKYYPLFKGWVLAVTK